MQCRLVSGLEALEHFATFTGTTQSQQHIKPLHWYVACRLVLEGGFRPEEITPHPPFRSVGSGAGMRLVYDESVATNAERTILGGLKTKNVDVVVTKDGIGPVVAISVKGTVGAFRNLTNRMEEAVGDCTNLHITYPALVTGFMTVLRANRMVAQAAGALPAEGDAAARAIMQNDVAIDAGGTPVETIIRYHNALRELSGRRGIRDDVSSYEAVSLALVMSNAGVPGTLEPVFPTEDSPIHPEGFFPAIYRSYDERYVYSAPDLRNLTARREWTRIEGLPVVPDSLGYDIRQPGEGAEGFVDATAPLAGEDAPAVLPQGRLDL